MQDDTLTGKLFSAETGKYIRPASLDEIFESLKREESETFMVGTLRCYVEIDY